MRTQRVAGGILLIWGVTLGCSSSSDEPASASSSTALSASQSTKSYHESGDRDGDHDDRDDHRREHPVSCAISRESVDVFDLSITKTADFRGKLLSASLTAVADEKAHTFSETTRLMLGDRQIYSSTVDTNHDLSFHATFDYSRSFRGPAHVDVSSADGKAATAVVDGRPTRNFSVGDGKRPREVLFENGRPVPPTVLKDDELESASRELFERLAREGEPCLNGKIDAAAQPPSIQAPALFRAAAASMSLTQDPIGTYDGITGVICAGEQLGVGVGWGICVGSGASGSAVCGPFAWACVIGVVVVCSGTAYAASAGFSSSEACCPHRCGKVAFEPECCDDQGECMSDGLHCCENGSACGGECCAPGIKCVGGRTCCKAGAECGNNCCDDGTGAGGVCIDPESGTCCLTPNRPCFKSACCEPTEDCSAGPDGQGLCTPKPPACADGITECIGTDVSNCPIDEKQGNPVCFPLSATSTLGCCGFNGK